MSPGQRKIAGQAGNPNKIEASDFKKLRAKRGKKVMAKQGLYANIHAKRKRIAAGSGEKMRKPGAKGAPTASNFKRAAKTAKKK